MDNPDTLATLGTQDTRRIQQQQQQQQQKTNPQKKTKTKNKPNTQHRKLKP